MLKIKEDRYATEGYLFVVVFSVVPKRVYKIYYRFRFSLGSGGTESCICGERVVQIRVRCKVTQGCGEGV
jgi:hypothetical protein